LLKIVFYVKRTLLGWVLPGQDSVGFLDTAFERLVCPIDGISEGSLIVRFLPARQMSERSLDVQQHRFEPRDVLAVHQNIDLFSQRVNEIHFFCNLT